MLRRILIYLYPRHWRHRYGEEFARLLDDMPLSTGVIANVLGAATREWVLRTAVGRLVLGPALAYAALLSAQLLSVMVGAQPTFTYEGGQTIVTPSWPVGLGVIQPLLGFVLLGRIVLGFLRQTRISEREFICWAFCLFIGAAFQQWALLEANVGTGIAPRSLWEVWSYAAVDITSKLIFLLLISRGLPDRSPYASSRPLGLS